MKLLLRFIVLITFTWFSGCDQPEVQRPTSTHPALYATLYQQQAAEYRALCYQAFTVAGFTLDAALATPHEKPLAVVVDIDETVLDNSPYQAQAIIEGFGYPVAWAEWIQLADAQPVPGALDFLMRAATAGVEVFYITNRKEEFRVATLQNLVKLGFPDADDKHLLMRTTSNEKESRRLSVASQYEIVCLIGDNMGDFAGVFDITDAALRMQAVDDNRGNLGSKWVVLPNVVYGHWVDVLSGFDRNLPEDSLNAALIQGLHGFNRTNTP
jgi:5'-nucleotidase (lipoprotein e(P4) family)